MVVRAVIVIAIGVVVLGTSVTTEAQWFNQPTTGIPRTADGKPNLAAPAPRTADGRPDLSGLWRMNPGAYGGNLVADLKPDEIKSWAEALFKERTEELGRDDPVTYKCWPQGPRAIFNGGWARIIQTPTLVAILYDDLRYRLIHLDGRKLPPDPNPSFMGYSVGRWEGDTLVVDSVGFNDQTWLDFGGHPHTEALRITERIRRQTVGQLELSATFEDSKIYARPWTINVAVTFVPDTDMLEFVCNENEKDFAHHVGKASDEKKDAIDVPAAILQAYVGAYEFRPDANFVMTLNVVLNGQVLFIDIGGKDKQEMTPLTESTFSTIGGRIDFVRNAERAVTHMIVHSVEGDFKAVRK